MGDVLGFWTVTCRSGAGRATHGLYRERDDAKRLKRRLDSDEPGHRHRVIRLYVEPGDDYFREAVR